MTDSEEWIDDDRLKKLVFYIVVDVSYSMKGDPIAAANALLPELFAGLRNDPMIADVVSIGLITFSDEARVIIPMNDPRNIELIPHLEIQGGTSYKAAFDLLRKTIDADVYLLKFTGYRVFRPAVFFITDGAPTDDDDELRASWNALNSSSFKPHPNVIPCGVGEATEAVLQPYLTPRMRTFVAKQGVNVAAALKALAEVLLGTILSSANSRADSTEADAPEDDDEFPTAIEFPEPDADDEAYKAFTSW